MGLDSLMVSWCLISARTMRLQINQRFGLGNIGARHQHRTKNEELLTPSPNNGDTRPLGCCHYADRIRSLTTDNVPTYISAAAS
ncbi:hypothetical protein F4781DRAFT_16415 [Annulohypoxylon bovei var. microspora]|nr:hypothetical protein F4781DRAFT_16415 [Annulohypoxylon bovei var. microspora]